MGDCRGNPGVEKAPQPRDQEERASPHCRCRRGLNRGKHGHRFSFPALAAQFALGKVRSQATLATWPCGNKPSGETSDLVESSSTVMAHFQWKGDWPVCKLGCPFKLGEVLQKSFVFRSEVFLFDYRRAG
jgi:hypothetical protein